MCCFSQKVDNVSTTRIFSRVSGGRQFLVYELRLASANDVAMVLPLPVRADAAPALQFIDLSGYPEFFNHLGACFRAQSLGLSSRAAAAGALAVEKVGAFDASLVPTAADFARLDPRFRLPDAVWDALPDHRDYGFAVFKLAAGSRRVHPMALWFESRRPEATFFPTVHVHDGAVHPTADFDHELYLQSGRPPPYWKRAAISVEVKMVLRDVLMGDLTRGIVDPTAPAYRSRIKGSRPNSDVWV